MVCQACSTPAAELWSQLRAGDSTTRSETSEDLHLELYLTGAVRAWAGRLAIRNRICALVFGKGKNTELRPQYEGYTERILIASYQAHQDSRSVDVRVRRFAVAILALEVGILSIDGFRDREYRTSQQR